MASYSCDVCDIRFPFKSCLDLERHLMSKSHQLFAEVVSDYKKQFKPEMDSYLSQIESHGMHRIDDNMLSDKLVYLYSSKCISFT